MSDENASNICVGPCQKCCKKYLPRSGITDLVVHSHSSSFQGRQDNFAIWCMNTDNNRRIGKCRLRDQNKRQTTSHNFSCDQDICSSKHVSVEFEPLKVEHKNKANSNANTQLK